MKPGLEWGSCERRAFILGGVVNIMEYNYVNKELALQFPALNIDEDDFELPYIAATYLTRYMLNEYERKNYSELKRGFEFIEKLHLSKDIKTRELATVGYLESIQNTWTQELVVSKDIYEYLGCESRKWYDELNRFWNGEIKYLGETFSNCT